MRNKYKANHKQNFFDYLKEVTKTIIFNIPNPVVKENKYDDITSAFVAGCGNSGTTLISGKLSNHEKTFLVNRESGIFLPKRGLLYAKGASKEWYFLAKQLEKTHVIEKTPKHVHCINRIKKILPNAKIILIVRNPADNIASLYERFEDLNLCIERWIIDNKELLAWVDSKDTILIKYQELTKQPEKEFKKICKFLNLSWEESIIEPQSTSYEKKDLNSHQKKRYGQVSMGIYHREDRWKEALSEEQYEIIAQRTRKVARELNYHL